MGWFRKDREKCDHGRGGHESPVQIDLGFQQRPWEVEMLVTKLGSDGLRVHLTTQAQVPEMGGLGPKRCMLLVAPDDEPRLRAELQAAGFL